MSVITAGTTFSNGEQLTADKLNLMIRNATFDNSAVDLTSTFVDSNGAIVVRDDGITEAKIASNAVTTNKIANSNVTKAKIENVADMKVLGNTSGSATAPQEVSILDEDDMASDSATSLATQQSIKAYVDNSTAGFTPSTYAGEESVTLPNGLIMKWGKINPSTGSNTVTYGTAFPTATINVQYARFKATHSIYEDNNAVTSESASGFNIYVTNGSAYGTLAWQAIGY